MSNWESIQIPFEKYLLEVGLATGTIKSYLRDVQAFYNWYQLEHGLPDNPADFTVADVEAYKAYLLYQHSHSPATINRSLQSLRKYGQFMATQLGLGTNKAGNVRLSKVPAFSAPVTLPPKEQLLLEKFAQGRQSLHGFRDYLILRLLLCTGVRAKELVLLRWQHFDFPLETVKISHQSVNKKRTLLLPSQLLSELSSYREQMDGQPGDYLFQGRGDRPLSIRMVQQLITNLGREYGLALNVKMLRNSYADTLWKRTGNLELLAKRMGYKSIATALRHIMQTPSAGEAEWDNDENNNKEL